MENEEELYERLEQVFLDLQNYMPLTNLQFFPIIDNLIQLGKRLKKDTMKYETILFEQQIQTVPDFTKVDYLPFKGLLEWRKAEWLLKKDQIIEAKTHFLRAYEVLKVTHQEYTEFLKEKESFLKVL